MIWIGIRTAQYRNEPHEKDWEGFEIVPDFDAQLKEMSFKVYLRKPNMGGQLLIEGVEFHTAVDYVERRYAKQGTL
jgi:hypothetical protein